MQETWSFRNAWATGEGRGLSYGFWSHWHINWQIMYCYININGINQGELIDFERKKRMRSSEHSHLKDRQLKSLAKRTKINESERQEEKKERMILTELSAGTSGFQSQEFACTG